MNSGYRFEKITPENKIVFEVNDEHVNLATIISDFEDFLRGCGFVIGYGEITLDKGVDNEE